MRHNTLYHIPFHSIQFLKIQTIKILIYTILFHSIQAKLIISLGSWDFDWCEYKKILVTSVLKTFF